MKILSKLIGCSILAVTLLSTANAKEIYTPKQTLTGSIPGSPVFADSFGGTTKINGDYLFVAAPIARPDSKVIAGAIYVYKKKDNQWVETQIITTSGTSDHLGALSIESQKDWLLISAVGTPVGAASGDPDLLTSQNFTGAVLVYRLDHKTGQWTLKQTLDKNTKGLENLSVISLAALDPTTNPFSNEQGANFGLQFSLDIEHESLLVGAQYQQQTSTQGNPLINSGTVFAFKLNKDKKKWELTQTITNPDGITENNTFGWSVAVHKDVALISSGSMAQAPKGVNSAVYVYQKKEGKWHFVERLYGDQVGPTLQVLSPISSITKFPNATPVGDAFGSSIALSAEWAMIGAGLESKNSSNLFKGAVYFYKIKNNRGTAHLVRTQKIFSDDPNTNGMAIARVQFSKDLAYIQDSMRSGPTGNPRQGGVLVYKLKKNTWKHVKTIFDPNGQPFDFFGYGLTANDKYVVIGTDHFSGALELDSFINVSPLAPFPLPPTFTPALTNGKAVIFKHKSK